MEKETQYQNKKNAIFFKFWKKVRSVKRGWGNL